MHPPTPVLCMADMMAALLQGIHPEALTLDLQQQIRHPLELDMEPRLVTPANTNLLIWAVTLLSALVELVLQSSESCTRQRDLTHSNCSQTYSEHHKHQNEKGTGIGGMSSTTRASDDTGFSGVSFHHRLKSELIANTTHSLTGLKQQTDSIHPSTQAAELVSRMLIIIQ